MDNKQAISELKCLREDYWDDDGYGHETKEYEYTMIALDKAIASLEAWDKVIEEIERQYQINRRVLHVDYYNVGIEQALEIINKHLV